MGPRRFSSEFSLLGGPQFSSGVLFGIFSSRGPAILVWGSLRPAMSPCVTAPGCSSDEPDTLFKNNKVALYHKKIGQTTLQDGGSSGQIFRTTAEPHAIVAARPLNALQHRVRTKSSARDLPRRASGIALRGPPTKCVTWAEGATGYAPGLARSQPIVSRVKFSGMRDPAPSMSSILEAFRC